VEIINAKPATDGRPPAIACCFIPDRQTDRQTDDGRHRHRRDVVLLPATARCCSAFPAARRYGSENYYRSFSTRCHGVISRRKDDVLWVHAKYRDEYTRVSLSTSITRKPNGRTSPDSEADLGMSSMFGRTGAPTKRGPHKRAINSFETHIKSCKYAVGQLACKKHTVFVYKNIRGLTFFF